MTQQPDTAPETGISGKDLARQLLADYKARTWAIPGRPTRKPTQAVRKTPGSGRDPVGLGGVIKGLTGDADWETAIGGGSIIDQWATLCPQFASTIQPVAFDAASGRFDLRPSTHAHAANLRLLGGQLCKQINDKAGQAIVRSIRVLPVGTITAATAPVAREEHAAPAQPIRTRETASPGYRRALAAHREHQATPPPVNRHLEAARRRQEQALADPAYREPDTAFTDTADVEGQVTTLTTTARSAAVLQAARAEAHRLRAGGTAPVRRAFDVA